VGDIIFSGTNPAPSLVMISLLKIVRPFSWLLLVHDVFPENLVAAQVIRKNNIAYCFIKAIYDRVYSAPTILIAIGRDMKKVLSEKTKSKSEIVYIPNWADADDIIPPKNSCAAIGKTGNVVFQFFGNLGRLQDIDNILDAIKLTKSKTASYEFIGHGSEVETILAFIKNNPTVAITHKPGVPFGSGNAILSECDVAIVSLATGMNGLAVPSKSYFSLAADKPLLVITDQGSELHQLIVEENSIGWYCEAANPQKLAQLIDEICSSDLSKLQGKPRVTMLNKYEHINAIEQYSKLISGLIN
jgi:glycosyltransferase involved in cell wall biosynthesis